MRSTKDLLEADMAAWKIQILSHAEARYSFITSVGDEAIGLL
jgi:hypothetical protein